MYPLLLWNKDVFSGYYAKIESDQENIQQCETKETEHSLRVKVSMDSAAIFLVTFIYRQP